jgi:hypothetical protein
MAEPAFDGDKQTHGDVMPAITARKTSADCPLFMLLPLSAIAIPGAYTLGLILMNAFAQSVEEPRR